MSNFSVEVRSDEPFEKAFAVSLPKRVGQVYYAT